MVLGPLSKGGVSFKRRSGASFKKEECLPNLRALRNVVHVVVTDQRPGEEEGHDGGEVGEAGKQVAKVGVTRTRVSSY